MLSFDLKVPFPTVEAATIAQRALSVDGPLEGTTKSLKVLEVTHPVEGSSSVTGVVLEVQIKSPSSRSLRVATHAVMEQLDLVLRTLDAFWMTRSR